MNNAELIKELRVCGDEPYDITKPCKVSPWKLMRDAADALEAAMAEINRKNETIQGLRSEIVDLKDEVRATAVAVYEYEGAYADWILDIIEEGDRDIDEVKDELEARMKERERDEQ